MVVAAEVDTAAVVEVDVDVDLIVEVELEALPQLKIPRLAFWETVAEAVATPVTLAAPEAEAAALSMVTDSWVAVTAGPVKDGEVAALIEAKSIF